MDYLPFYFSIVRILTKAFFIYKSNFLNAKNGLLYLLPIQQSIFSHFTLLHHSQKIYSPGSTVYSFFPITICVGTGVTISYRMAPSLCAHRELIFPCLVSIEAPSHSSCFPGFGWIRTFSNPGYSSTTRIPAACS